MYTIHIPNIKKWIEWRIEKSAVSQMFYLDIIKILQKLFLLNLFTPHVINN